MDEAGQDGASQVSIYRQIDQSGVTMKLGSATQVQALFFEAQNYTSPNPISFL